MIRVLMLMLVLMLVDSSGLEMQGSFAATANALHLSQAEGFEGTCRCGCANARRKPRLR